jgi:hypothetical protein
MSKEYIAPAVLLAAVTGTGIVASKLMATLFAPHAVSPTGSRTAATAVAKAANRKYLFPAADNAASMIFDFVFIVAFLFIL